MANICITDYRILGEQDVLKCIMDAINRETSFLGYANANWAGNTLAQLGISPDEAGRAWWNDAQIIDGVLYFWEEGAWSRGNAINLLQKHFPELEIIFKSEELGCEIYETNDVEKRFFTEEFLFVAEDMEECEFENSKEVLDYIHEQYSETKGIEDIDEINDVFRENDIEAWLYQIEYVDSF